MFVPRTISFAVDGVARQVIGKDWSLYAALLSHWGEIVGEEYARVSTPVKISFPKGKQGGNGVLHIRLPQGLVMEFTFMTDKILQRISTYFGGEAISRIMFEPYYGDSVTPSKMAYKGLNSADSAKLSAWRAAAGSIPDDETRSALEALGRAILADNGRQ